MIGRHPSREVLLAFEHLRGRRRRRVGDHLARCRTCRARLSGLRALREAAAAATDARPARDLWSGIDARLEEGDVVILPVQWEGTGADRRLPRAAVAALVFLLAFAGVAAAAVLLTPLGRFVGRDAAPVERVAPASGPLPARAVEVAVPPGGLTVALPDASDDFRLQVTLRDGRLLALVPSNGGEALTFRAATTRVEVTGAGRGSLEVSVPVTAPAVRIMVRGTTVAVVHAGRVRAVGREAGPDLAGTVGELVRASGADLR